MNSTSSKAKTILNVLQENIPEAPSFCRRNYYIFQDLN